MSLFDAQTTKFELNDKKMPKKFLISEIFHIFAL